MQLPDKVIYFAYGSNLLFARLYARTPSIKKLGTGKLSDHRMHFNKPGGDGSGKCGIEKIKGNEFVFGVLYEMDSSDKPILDKIEGVGRGYVDQTVVVQLGKKNIDAFTYYPTQLNCEAKPFDWYKAFVLIGARENNFPSEYISSIESIESEVDLDGTRRATNFEICGISLSN